MGCPQVLRLPLSGGVISQHDKGNKTMRSPVQRVKSLLFGAGLALAALLPSVGLADITISEVMAKNEECLATKSGVKGIDWVELYNSGNAEVDVSGWYLGNDPKANPTLWAKIQGSCRIPAGGYKVVFCDGDGLCKSWDSSEAHVACKLSGDAGKHTLFIASAANADSIIQQCKLPKSFDDVSIAMGRAAAKLIDENATAEYKVGDGEYKSVSGSIGMSSDTSAGFQVVTYRIDVSGIEGEENHHSIWDIDVAKNCLEQPQCWRSGYPVTKVVKKLAFRGSTSIEKGEGAFGDEYTMFPGITETKNFVMDITTGLNVPRSGDWTFAIGCNDGFEATISRYGKVVAQWYVTGEHSYNVKNVSPTRPDMQLKACNLEAGAYELRIVYYDCEGGCVLDFSAAEGNFSSFDGNQFKLVGTEACAIRLGSSFGAQIANDVAKEMLGKSQEVTWRKAFKVESSEAQNSCKLRLRYADGFTAKINGETFASVAANGPRSAADATSWSEYAIPAAKIKIGDNTLEVIGMNDAKGDTEFLLHPTVVCEQGELTWMYYREPTPGAANTTAAKNGVTPSVEFSVPHGFKTSSFKLEITCPSDSSRRIYYTLDGTKPTPNGSIEYTGPFTISKTTVVRAAVADPDSILQTDASATYLFVDDILENQRANAAPAGFPRVNDYTGDKGSGQKMWYGLNDSIMNDSDARARLKRSFSNIRTASIVMDPKDLFDSTKGIYVNAVRKGRDWERQTMLEQIYPADTKDEFSTSCGIKIRGAASRAQNYPKRGFHMIFRDEYGASRLEHPLFGNEGAKSFKRFDFRCEQNNAWQNKWEGCDNETMLNDVFSRDSQRDMGQPYNRSRYYHLFINGIYWGVYQTEERVEKNNAADYMGGNKNNYDVVRTSNDQTISGGVADKYFTTVVEGDETDDGAWAKLHAISLEGYGEGHEANWYKVRGLNADGTRNPNYPILLDVTNLVCYLMTSHFVADGDSPANGEGMANNIIAYRNRVEGESKREGFKWIRHDSEHSLAKRDKCPNGYETDDGLFYNGSFDKGGSGGNYLTESERRARSNFNPNALHCALMKNMEYHRLFMDLAYKYLVTPGGAMTTDACLKRHDARKAEIADAVAGELARWGRGHTYADWLENCAEEETFIKNRVQHLALRGAYHKAGWQGYFIYGAPQILDKATDIPLTNGMPAVNCKYARLTSDDGTVYYTTDGTDPWIPGEVSGDEHLPWRTDRTTPKLTATANAYSESEPIEIPSTGITIRARCFNSAGNAKEWSPMTEIRLLGEGEKPEEDEPPVVEDEVDFSGDYDDLVVITEEGKYVCENANFKKGIKIADGITVKLNSKAGSVNTAASISAPGAEVRFTGEGEMKLSGKDTLMTVSNLVIKTATLVVESTGVSTDKTPVVKVLGYVEQEAGALEIDLDAVSGTQAYGIYVANKNPGKDAEGKDIIYAEFGGGRIVASVNGAKSSAIYVNKGSVDTVFKGGVTVEATLNGSEARFVSVAGDLEFKHCDIAVTSEASDARVFKSDKDIKVVDPAAHIVATASGANSEIFSSADRITVGEGVLELEATDDCFSATTNITVNGGHIYAVSTADDVFDSNGDMELNGGVILAYTMAKGHEAFDVEPENGASGGDSHELRVNGGVIFATGRQDGSQKVWPANLVTGCACFTSDATSIGGAYLELAGAGANYTAKLPVSSGTCALFATCPGYTANSFKGSAPSSGSQDFHDYYVYSTEATNQDQLRFYEIYGSTTGDGDTDEYIVLTNISDKTVSLAGLKVNVEKLKDWKDKGESGSKCLFTLSSGEVPAYGSVRLEQTDFWSSGKISNGDIYLALTDSAGGIVQSGEADFGLYTSTDGGGAALRAAVFSKTEMTSDTTHWIPSVGGTPVDPVDPGEDDDDEDPATDYAKGGNRLYYIEKEGYWVHEFTSTDKAKKFKNLSGKALEVEYLVVGGGGAGGDGHPDKGGFGGGGGGGGVLDGTATIAADGSWSVTVGVGGSLKSSGGERIAYDVARGLAGDSVISNGGTEIAKAPGGGAGGCNSGNGSIQGQGGAAGGGASSNTKFSKSDVGKGSFESHVGLSKYGQFDGGFRNESGTICAGGGGGAGGAGADGSSSGSGAGGAGLTSSI